MTYPGLNYSLGDARREVRIREAMAQQQQDAMFRMNAQTQSLPKQDFFNPYQDGLRWPQPKPSDHWSRVLNVEATASPTEIKVAYRALAKKAHSDRGGSDAAMTRLNVARDQALKEVGQS
ncbi:MAG: J domain-containing protein [Agrobacterium cavarae]